MKVLTINDFHPEKLNVNMKDRISQPDSCRIDNCVVCAQLVTALFTVNCDNHALGGP